MKYENMIVLIIALQATLDFVASANQNLFIFEAGKDSVFLGY